MVHMIANGFCFMVRRRSIIGGLAVLPRAAPSAS
jgi:hypothetical protein